MLLIVWKWKVKAQIRKWRLQLFKQWLPWKITLQEVSVKLRLWPYSCLLSDIVLCNRYFQKDVLFSAEQIFSDVLHLIILSYIFIFFKILFWKKNKRKQTKQTNPQTKTSDFSRTSILSFKTDFSDILSFCNIINQGEEQELLYLFHSCLFPMQVVTFSLILNHLVFLQQRIHYCSLSLLEKSPDQHSLDKGLLIFMNSDEHLLCR